jgi:hypothetical protein
MTTIGKLGKLPPVHDLRTKSFGDLVHKFGLVAPPYYRVDWSRKLNVPALGTLLNTRLGNCTCASKGHDLQLWTAWTGVQASVTDAEILRMYEAISGYNGTPQTDKGATILSALQWWNHNPIAGVTLDGYAGVEPGNITAAKTAIWNFGSLDIGLLLPNTCLDQVTWRYVQSTGAGAPGSAGGHDVSVIGYDDHAQLCTLITWGHTKQMSYKFFEVYCDEAWALACKSWVLASNHLTPSDINWTALLADLAQH